MVVFWGVACALVAAVRADTLERTVTGGVIQGQFVGANLTVQEYLGIPFAAPPVADFRFRPPQPVDPWKGTRQATAFGYDCPQNGVLSHTNEDCLYLNVFAPKGASPNQADPYSVMVWFYGGTWDWGGTSFFMYDGMWDVANNEDIIIVTVNYRVNVFGFLGSPAMASRSEDGSFGNYGIQDQRAAMQWVQDNIKNFGGNPSSVTIYGESAGAGSVSNHLVMERSWPLFHRALMESGPEARWTAQNTDQATCHYEQVLKATNCQGDKAIECLLALNTSTLLAQAESTNGCFDPVVSWSPVIDGVEISEKPEDLAKSGKVNKVPILLGTNHDEGTMFFNGAHDMTVDDVATFFSDFFGDKNLGTTLVTKYYNISDYASPWWMGSHIYGDAFMSCAARRTARWFTAAGAPTYLYFNTHIPYIMRNEKYKGVAHTFELFFVWHITPFVQGPGEVQLADQYVNYWTNFARTGNPNTVPAGSTSPSGTVKWPLYTAAGDQNIVMDVPLSTQSGLKATQCDFWDTYYENTVEPQVVLLEE